MRIQKFLMTMLVGFGFIGCGSGGGGNGNPDLSVSPDLYTPSAHMLAQSMPETISAGQYYGYNFMLPTAAQVSFSVSETTTDTWNVGVFSDSQWTTYETGAGNQVTFGGQNNVMSAMATSPSPLPAGSWWLGFHCDNLIESCMLVFNITATY